MTAAQTTKRDSYYAYYSACGAGELRCVRESRLGGP